MELIEKGNWKYFTCFKQAFITNKNEVHNWIKYISIFHVFTGIFLQIMYISSNENLIYSYDKNFIELINKKKENKIVNNNIKEINSKEIISIKIKGKKKSRRYFGI